MTITQNELEKTVKNKTDITLYCDLNGNELDITFMDGKAIKTSTLSEEQPIVYDEDQYIKIQINDSVRNFIQNYISALYGFRGLKTVENIDENDPEVKALIEFAIKNKMKIKNIKSRRKVKITDGEKFSKVQQIRNKYEPQNALALSQLTLLSIVYGDVVKVSGNQITSKFEDLEIPSSYWAGQMVVSENKEENEFEALDKMLTKHKPLQIFLDETNELEILIALSTVFFNKNPEVMDFIAKHKVLEKIITSMNFLNGGLEYDEIGFLENQLDELLS